MKEEMILLPFNAACPDLTKTKYFGIFNLNFCAQWWSQHALHCLAFLRREVSIIARTALQQEDDVTSSVPN